MVPVRHLISTAVLALAASGPASAQTLVLDLVDTQAGGIAVNPRGDVLGVRTVWPCGDPTRCAPETRPTVWRNGTATDLPGQAGFTTTPSALSPSGLVVGSLVNFASRAKAVAWQPATGGGYTLTELGTLGLATSAATGVTATDTVVGWARTDFVSTRAFSWTSAGGMVDLTGAGFPDDRPQSVSPGGSLISDRFTWRLGDLGSVAALPTPPAGYFPTSGLGARINDAGDFTTNLVRTSSSSLTGTHRYIRATGQWQALQTDVAPIQGFGVTALEADATALGRGLGGGFQSNGPTGPSVALQDRLSPAYATVGTGLATARGRDATGAYLVDGSMGAATRLFRVVEQAPCVGACLRVANFEIAGRFVNDPGAPGSCTDLARNRVAARVTVTDASGAPVSGVKVRARVLDTYDLNRTVSATTGADGRAVLRHEGPACRGTITVLVEGARRTGWTLDRTVGTLAGSVIPLP